MRRSIGLIGVLLALAVGGYLYMRQAESAAAPGGGGNVRATVDVTGVKQDLLAIASAERAYMAKNGRYTSIDELVSAGELTMARAGRQGWEYTAEVGDTNFRVVATYSGPPQAGSPRQLSIDDSMQVKTE